MKKTLVTVDLNGSSGDHIFDMPLNEFKDMWDNHISGAGFFTGVDENGVRTIINPSQCAVIEMRGW